MKSMSEPQVDALAQPSITDAYVSEESRVLDPAVLDKSLIERMPEPAGWRILVLPYKGKGVTEAVYSFWNLQWIKKI